MANKNQVLGETKVTSAALGLLETDGQSTLDIGGKKREAVTGDNQASAFKASTEPSKFECNLLVKGGLSLSQIRAIDNDTLTIEFDTGQTFVVRAAYSADVPTVATSDGKAKVVFQGPPAEELR
ncbi:MAG: hypothetical protein EOP62_14375 [Sphingomonadales bacterium]|nr:MAG: hypothetical protein EOP62_14375 [Sphingomonadales bacterium]